MLRVETVLHTPCKKVRQVCFCFALFGRNLLEPELHLQSGCIYENFGDEAVFRRLPPVKALYCSLMVLLCNLYVLAQQMGSQDESPSPPTHTIVPDKYVAMGVLLLFGLGIFIVVEKFRRQRGRKLKQYPQPEDIEQIRRRLNDVA
jgi:hypothetical protein